MRSPDYLSPVPVFPGPRPGDRIIRVYMNKNKNRKQAGPSGDYPNKVRATDRSRDLDNRIGGWSVHCVYTDIRIELYYYQPLYFCRCTVRDRCVYSPQSTRDEFTRPRA